MSGFFGLGVKPEAGSDLLFMQFPFMRGLVESRSPAFQESEDGLIGRT
jgi:hypothetical protein